MTLLCQYGLRGQYGLKFFHSIALGGYAPMRQGIPGIACLIQEEIEPIIAQMPFWKSGFTFRIAAYAIRR